MTNLLFLLPGAAVLEVRPEGYDNACYHYLADRCRLAYYLALGRGDKRTPINVNVAAVVRTVQAILPLDKVDRSQ